jgi:hypothetical protein
MGTNVQTIGNTAFAYCVRLANVTIGESVTYIGDSAFYDCVSLTWVSIPASVSSIGAYSFAYSSVTNVSLTYGLATIGDYAFYNCASLPSIAIPGSVTNLGAWVFVCPNFGGTYSVLTNVVLTNGLITIGDYAFDDCQRLQSVALPSTLVSIGRNAFAFCSGLQGLTIPDSVISIGPGAFLHGQSLTNLTVGKSLASIGDSAFWECFALGGSLTLPDTVTNVGPSAFGGCSFTSVKIGNGDITIGTNAFGGDLLTNVTIGNGVVTIQDQAFAYCSKLRGVYFGGDAPSAASSAFSNDPLLTLYYLPGTTGWSNTLGGAPTALWNPTAQTTDGSFGIRSNQFGFNITGTTNIPIVVEACTDLASSAWTALQGCNLTNGSIYFSDPDWTNYPARFYRIRSP